MSELSIHDGRQARLIAPGLGRLAFQVEPVPPFRLDLTVWALRRRASNAVDRWDGATYRRVLVVEGRPLGIEVVQVAPPERPQLQVTVSGSHLRRSSRSAVLSALTRMLGCDRCLTDFYRAAVDDPILGPLAQAYRGLKPPRYPTLFETLVNAFACQQVTLSLGIQLLNRLAAACAPSLDGIDELERQDDATAMARLLAWRGVGRWTAEYVLLRGLGRLHVFPGDDVGARNNLQRWLGLLESLDYDGVQRALAPWAPFQGLVYLHLLLRSLRLECDSDPGPLPRKRRLGAGMLR